MTDGLPMLPRKIGMARGPEQRWGQKEQDDRHRAGENHHWKHQQLLVCANDRQRTLQQQPTSLKLAHRYLPFFQVNNVCSPAACLPEFPDLGYYKNDQNMECGGKRSAAPLLGLRQQRRRASLAAAYSLAVSGWVPSVFDVTSFVY